MKTRLLSFLTQPGFKPLKIQLQGLFMACALVLCGMGASAQTAPVISYSSPQVYNINTTIPTLSPNTTGGGVVPATIYGNVTTIAPSPSVPLSGNTMSSFMVADHLGNLYVTTGIANILKIAQGTHTVTNFVTNLAEPTGIAMDASGNLYVSEATKNDIKKITPTGVITTFAGTGSSGHADGTALSATFSTPNGLAFDATGPGGTPGNLWVADESNSTIRKIAITNGVAGMVTTIGTVNSFGHQDGTSPIFDAPISLTFDANGNLYVAESNNFIRKIVNPNTTPNVSTYAGSTANTGTHIDGPASTAGFNGLESMVFDGAGNLYVTELNNNDIRLITAGANPIVSTIAGNASSNVNNPVDGTGTGATFSEPVGMYMDASGTVGPIGTIYIADVFVGAIRAMSISGYTITPALLPGLSMAPATGIIMGTTSATVSQQTYTVTAYNYFGSSMATLTIDVESVAAPRFSYPAGLTNGTVFPTGNTISFSPTPLGGAIPMTTFGTVSNSNLSSLKSPGAIAPDGAGNLYVTNFGTGSNNDGSIMKISSSGTGGVSTVLSNLSGPFAMTYNEGALYATTRTNQVLKFVISTGVASIIAGSGMKQTGGDGNSTVLPLSAHLGGPDGVAVDPAGNIYIADENDAQIRILKASTGMLSLFAGSPAGPTGATSVDGVGIAATFKSPSSIVVDPTGNYLYVADNVDGVIRRIVINAAAGVVGTVITFAGKAGTTGNIDGIGTSARFGTSSTAITGGSLAIDASGNLYIGDSGNNTIRMVTPAAQVFTIASGFTSPQGTCWDLTTGNIFEVDGASSVTMKQITGTGYFIEGINPAGSAVTLPAGLTFTSSSGVLGGKPTTSTATATYSIFGFNNNPTKNSYYTTVSIGVGATFTWFGFSTTAWATPMNWNPSGPPGVNDIAIIPNFIFNLPTITTAVTVGAIQFTGTGSGSNTLTITSPGSLMVNNGLTLSTNATITGTGPITLAPTATLDVGKTNTLTYTAAAGGSFTLASNATSSASVAQITTGSITGTFTVQRYLQGGSLAYRGYRLLSSPVATTTSSGVSNLNYLTTVNAANGTTGIPVTGPGSGFTADPNNFNNPSLFVWKESTAGTQATFFTSNYRAFGSLGSPPYNIVNEQGTYNIPIGNGFLAFVRGPLSLPHTIAAGGLFNIGTFPPATGAILGATGTLNQGQVKVQLWWSGSTAFTFTNGVPFPGYTLVGNPYASSIDWDTFATSGTPGILGSTSVSSTIHVLDPVSHNYGAYITGNGGIGTLNATNVIASGQGFFLITTAAGATLTFNETAKIQTQNVGFNLLESTSAPTPIVLQYLRLRLATDSVNTDETMLRFTNTATNLAYNKNTDATYQPGNGIESLASLSSDKVAVAIKALPLPGPQGQTIPLVVNATSDGLYTLGLHDIVAVPQLYQVWLKDALVKDSLDLRSNDAYAFNITHADTNSFGSHRFSLVIRQNPALGLHLLSFAAAKAGASALITWVTENEANYTNFTLQRSTDNGVSFATIGGFASTSAGAYSFTDAAPAKPADEYRLQLTDVNGTVTYSAVVTLGYNNQNSIAGPIVIYPNPAKGLLNVSITQALGAAANQSVGITTPVAATGKVYGIKIISITGLVVKTATTAQATWQTDISNLTPGTYIVQVVDGSNNNLIGKGQFIKL